MKNKKQNFRESLKLTTLGFTLVELLAVIVILAIILVIAVPKVMSVIEDSKKATLESTAKMIASAAEKAKVQNTVLGKDEEITCDSVAKINKLDYETCEVVFEDNIAKVSIKGSGKFAGLYVCNGDKANSIATTKSCGLISLTVNLAGGTDNVDYKESYEAGSEVVLTDPTREGYSFMGWSVIGTSASIIDNKLKLGEDATTVTAIWEEYSEDYPVLASGQKIRETIMSFEGLNEAIVEFEFVDSYTLTNNEIEVMDASYEQDRSILVYIIPISETKGKIVVVGNGSGGILLNEDSSYLFFGLPNLKVINGMDLLRWVNVTNTYMMFAYSGIESVVLGNAKTIGNSTFDNCSSLTSIEIPNSVTSIGVNAFRRCSSLTSIEIPNSVTSIGDSAFDDCSSLTSIEIPNSVTSIGNYAFYGCSSLTSIEIPNSVSGIGDSAFDGCSSLTSIEIPNSVTSIGINAFDGCSSLTSIEIPNSVTSIGDSTFDGCTSLTSITIPNSVTSIGNYAFQGCTSLTSITIPEGVTSIGGYAFYGCTSLTNITIPKSVTSIGDSTFDGCSSLTSITIPNSVTSIGNYAFDGCSSLTSIEIPNSVSGIGDSTFRGCSSLTSIEIPNSVTSIGVNAFDGCSSLTSITIPNSVTSIGNYAFYRCSGLIDVYYTGTSDEWSKISIGSSNGLLMNATVHYEHVIE